MKLLTTNTKLAKLNGERYAVAGLSLAPHTLGGRTTVCEWASKGCISACVLHFAGMHVMESVREAQRRRTQLLLDSPAVFHAQLERELNAFSRKCEKRDVTPLVRLNTASDLDWSATIRKFPEVQFYDYTASAKRAAANALGNYDITFSRKEVTADSTLRELLTMGVNVAIVFDVEYNPQHGKFGALPASWLGFPVVDGDKHDFRLREVDGHGVIVGLRLKGGLESKARARKTGFAVKP